MRSHSANPSDFAAFSGVGFTDTPAQRIYSDATLQGSLTVSMAEPLAHRRQAMRGVVIGLLLFLPLGLLGIWLAVRLSLAPLVHFRRAAPSVGNGDGVRGRALRTVFCPDNVSLSAHPAERVLSLTTGSYECAPKKAGGRLAQPAGIKAQNLPNPRRSTAGPVRLYRDIL